MIEKVFYAVPKQMGYYDGLDEQQGENDFEEVPLDDDDKPIRKISSNRHSNASSVRSKQSKK
jgi:hypothetical protein